MFYLNLLDEMTSSYKKKKESEQRNLSNSSHNWNALFLGANAVADIMAERYAFCSHFDKNNILEYQCLRRNKVTFESTENYGSKFEYHSSYLCFGTHTGVINKSKQKRFFPHCLLSLVKIWARFDK